MKLHILGYSPPFPNAGRATSSYLIESNRSAILIDCGHGSVGKLLQHYSPDDLSAIVISHMHPDHFYDLIPLRNVYYRYRFASTPLYLPPGGAAILRDVIRASVLPGEYMDEFFDIHEYAEGDLPASEDFTISIQKTVHPIDTYALSFIDAIGKRFVYTSDTAWSADVVKFCQGADLLLIECTDPPDTVAATPRWHLSPQEVATFVNEVGPSAAVITHYEDNYSSEIYSLVSGANPRSQIRLAIEHEEFTI